jgi:serine/threonine-protein kinase
MRMPDLVGKSFEEAKREIENYHLILGNIETKESLNIGSTVLEQSIKPYESVMPYATIIDLVVSKQVEFAPMLDVKGKKADEAKKLLKGYGLKNVKVEYVYTSKDDGIVIDQNVSAGENVSADTSIIIYVNVHANTSVVPDLSGKTLEEAQALLAAENITDIEITTEKSFKPEGTVIYQSVPAGTEVLKGNKIEIIISSESETIAMKDFYGKTPEEAEKWFKRVGISYIIGDQVDSNEKTGVIISQSIPAYFSVSRGETVRIYVNRYVPSETESSEELAQ